MEVEAPCRMGWKLRPHADNAVFKSSFYQHKGKGQFDGSGEEQESEDTQTRGRGYVSFGAVAGAWPTLKRAEKKIRNSRISQNLR